MLSMQALLEAPGVKDRKALAFNRDDALKGKDAAVTGLLRSIVATASPAAQRSAFFVLDLDEVVGLFRAWRAALPAVRPYYAVKCNPEPALVGALAALGAGFDCASAAEIKALLALGVHPRDVVYNNSFKHEADIEYAAEVGVDLTTYDTEEEVAKLKRCHPKCDLLLRLMVPDPGAMAAADPGTKFGALSDEVALLLRAARRAGLSVAGVCFHVQNSASRLDVLRAAFEAARAAFDAAAAIGMPPMRVLDIGGGFVAGGAAFDDEAAVVNDALARHFGDLPCVEVIGEPGKYFAETAFTLAARVIAKRTRGEVHDYWIDDGLYGALNCVAKHTYVPRPRPLAAVSHAGEKTYTSTVFGQTSDPQDKVVTGYQLPEMSVGDWLVFGDIGAYATAAASNFNGFATSDMKTYVAYCDTLVFRLALIGV